MEYVRVIQKVQSGERPAILTMLLCWSFEIAESFEFKHGFQIIRTCNFVPISNLDASMGRQWAVADPLVARLTVNSALKRTTNPFGKMRPCIDPDTHSLDNH